MIHVDPRIGSAHLLPLLEARGLPTQLTRMDFADVAFNGHGPGSDVAVGIELKKLDDLIGSLTTKRFQAHQLPGMLRTYQWPLLIIEGEYRESLDGLIERGVQYGSRLNWLRHRSLMTYQRLEGTLYTLTFATGFRIIKTRSESHTVAEIARLYRWWQKPWADHKSHKVGAKATPVSMAGATLDPWFNRDRYFAESVALQVPGLGEKRARAAAKHFRSVRRMAWAGTQAWTAVDGVGPVLAKKAHEVFGKEM